MSKSVESSVNLQVDSHLDVQRELANVAVSSAILNHLKVHGSPINQGQAEFKLRWNPADIGSKSPVINSPVIQPN